MPTETAAPPWAHSNANKLLESLDCSELMNLLMIEYRPGNILDKTLLRRDINKYISDYSRRGNLVKIVKDTFIIALKSFTSETAGSEEKCLAICEFSYKIRRTRVDFSCRTIMDISYHCLTRIFERDISNSSKIVSSALDLSFINSLNQFLANEVSLSADDLSFSHPFACNFLGGFLTGSARPMLDYLTDELMLVYDVRTYLPKQDKPQWLLHGSDRPVFSVDNEDRRAALMRERISSQLKS